MLSASFNYVFAFVLFNILNVGIFALGSSFSWRAGIAVVMLVALVALMGILQKGKEENSVLR